MLANLDSGTIFKKAFTHKLVFELLAIFLLCLSACRTTSTVVKVSHQLKAQYAFSLQMPEGDGYNGGGVAFVSKNKRYYAAFAGNKYFPLQAFDEKGKAVGEALKVNTDIRGLWYNPKTQELEANGFGKEPIVRYVFNNGIPYETEILIEDLKKPDAQAVATLDNDSDEILMFHEGAIYRFNHKTGEALGDYVLKSMPESYGINENVIAYTGIVGGEIALLDFQGKKVYLFQKNTGEFTGTIQLPAEAPTQRNFNFAFANRIIWLFDIEKRAWQGFRVN